MLIKKIYLDMDGVLADFDNGLLACGVKVPESAQEEETMWNTIRENEHFFDRLQPMPGAIEMFNTLYEKYGGRCELLSALPKPSKGVPGAGRDKMNWARRFLGRDTVVNLVYRNEKKDFCTGQEDILIDDYVKNIAEWESSGGIGILFTSAEDVLKRLGEIESSCG